MPRAYNPNPTGPACPKVPKWAIDNHPVFRFGIFSDGKYTPLPVPPTTAAVPNTIAW